MQCSRKKAIFYHQSSQPQSNTLIPAMPLRIVRFAVVGTSRIVLSAVVCFSSPRLARGGHIRISSEGRPAIRPVSLCRARRATTCSRGGRTARPCLAEHSGKGEFFLRVARCRRARRGVCVRGSLPARRVAGSTTTDHEIPASTDRLSDQHDTTALRCPSLDPAHTLDHVPPLHPQRRCLCRPTLGAPSFLATNHLVCRHSGRPGRGQKGSRWCQECSPGCFQAT